MLLPITNEKRHIDEINGLNVVRLHDEIARNMMGGWTKFDTPIIFVSHFHPFVHKEYEASIDTIINTYGDIDCTA